MTLAAVARRWNRKNDWAPEHDEMLKTKMADGLLSHAKIAGAINAEFGTGYSRNAAIGRAHRLGLVSAEKPRKPPKQRRRRKMSTEQKPRARSTKFRPDDVRIMQSPEYPNLRCVEVIPRNIGLPDLEPNDCRYPYGDGPYTFCGHPAIENTPYCLHHLALCTRTSSEQAAHR